ncbi:MAG: hypothetical protein PQJ46_08685, partial [Spirochaetales bacterium]|nr:hypothetical protein [Spirochaetales bacterium]
MIFRTFNVDEDISFLVDAIDRHLKQKGLISLKTPASRIFHYSKGPFEELLDCSGFLYDRDIKNIPLKEVSFGRFIEKRGLDIRFVERALYNPIMRFKEKDGKIVENDIFSYTKDLSYHEAYEKFCSVYSHRIVIERGLPAGDDGRRRVFFEEI